MFLGLVDQIRSAEQIQQVNNFTKPVKNVNYVAVVSILCTRVAVAKWKVAGSL